MKRTGTIGVAIGAAGLTLVVAVLASVAFVMLRQRWWGDDRAAIARVQVLRATGTPYERAIATTAEATGAPESYVRWLVPPAVYKAPCNETRRNPWRVVAATVGAVATAVVTVIAPPAGVAVGVVTGIVTAGQPAMVSRPCKDKS
jgi:hypothetical protein